MNRLVKSDISYSDAESDLDSSQGRNQTYCPKDDIPMRLRPVNKRFGDALVYHTYQLGDKASKYDDCDTKRRYKGKSTPSENEDNIFDSSIVSR